MMSDPSCHFFQSPSGVLLVSLICYLTRAQTAKHAVVVPPWLPLIKPCDISQKWVNGKEPAIKKESAAKKQRLITYKELQKKQRTVVISTLYPWRDSSRAARGISEDRLMSMRKVSVIKRMKMSEEVQRSDINKILPIKRTLSGFYDTENVWNLIQT